MKIQNCFVALTVSLLGFSQVLNAADESDQTRSRRVDVVHRSGEITGMTVKNRENQELGEIEDVVIDVTDGSVQYLAVSFGGFLGVGDKLFAVPADAFEIRRGDDADEYYLVLDADKKTLENAPGFNEDQWPNFVDKSWRAKVDRHYEGIRKTRKDRDGADVNVRIGDTSISTDIDRNRERPRGNDRLTAANDSPSRSKDTIHRASEMEGMKVMNEANQEIGDVHDVVIDLRRGTVKYIAISHGGLLSVGDKLFAVPFKAFECRQGDEEGEYYLVVNIDKETLENAPGFDQDKWPNFADSRWTDKNDRHYGGNDRRGRLERSGQRNR